MTVPLDGLDDVTVVDAHYDPERAATCRVVAYVVVEALHGKEGALHVAADGLNVETIQNEAKRKINKF